MGLLDEFYAPDYSKLKRGQFRQDTPKMREYAANVPVDLGRGTVAGLLGLLSDTLNFAPAYSPKPMEQFGDFDYAPSQKVPYGSEEWLKTLPLAPAADNPVGRVAGQIGTFAPMVPVQAARLAGRGATEVGKFVAPKAGQLAENYMQSMGMMPGIVSKEGGGLLGDAAAVAKVPNINESEVGGLLSPSIPIKPMAEVSPLGFYSAAEQAALNLQRNKGTGQSFLNDLMKAPDVKKDELSWIGLDDFLKDKPNVTKQEVQDFISQNKVDLQEVRLGESPVEDPIGIAKRKAVFDKYEPEIQQLYSELDNVTAKKRNALKLATSKYDDMHLQLNKDGYMPTAQDYEAFNLAERELTQANRMQNDDIDIRNRLGKIQNMRDAEADAAYVVPETIPTKYYKYQLPGGENYREILLKMPFKEPAMPKGYEVTSMQYDDGTVRYFANTPTTRSQGFRTQEEAQAELSKTASNLKGFRENLVSYQSSHFDEPNILAHMRVNDRVDAEGKKMLLVEEIQSDWHQAGREKGYIPANMQKAKDNIQKRLNEIDAERTPLYERQRLLKNAFNKESYIDELSAIQTKLNNLQNEYAPLANQLSTGLAGVPDAPFKDTWYQLSLKRLLKYAADNGYDRVGLTTGKQQADRYKLSNEVDEINVTGRTNMATGEKSKSVALDLTSGTQYRLGVDNNGVIDNVNDADIANFKGKKLSEVVGKDIAKQIMEGSSQTIKGEGLNIGGEGMKKYYDEIYPKFLEKYGKKYGAKMGETRIKTGRGVPGGEAVRYLDITPEMRKAVKKGMPLAAAENITTGLLA